MPMHKEFREKWVSAGYSRWIGSAEVCQPPSSNLRRVYHLMPAEYAVSSIALRRLKVARVADTNDRFEFLALRLRDREQRKLMQTHKTKFDEDTGLLCFTRNWTSPVLWSHYGDRHRGICLGFDLEQPLGEEVRYEDERLQKEIEPLQKGTELSEDLTDLLACTKSGHWKYEEETRMFVELKDALKEGNLHFRPYGTDLALREVIVGENCNLSVEKVRAFVSALHPEAITFKARLAINTFDVVPYEKYVP